MGEEARCGGVQVITSKDKRIEKKLPNFGSSVNQAFIFWAQHLQTWTVPVRQRSGSLETVQPLQI
jgi:hypothetical protein